MIGTVIVIAKAPVAGRVKTRLVPPLSYAQAATVAAAALDDTLRAAAATPARSHVLALDGEPDASLPRLWRVVAQPSGGLDARLVGAFAAAAQGPAVLVGMDTPQLSPAQLTAFDPASFDACLGLAADGGYWAIGLRDPHEAAAVINGVPMSTADTGAEQLRRMRAAGMRVQLLDKLIDVDTIAAAQRVARQIPASSFARTLDDMLRRPEHATAGRA